MKRMSLLEAIDVLTLDYTVRFPLSLVISRKTILRYQLLFRFLLHLKHVEQSLSVMWIEQKTMPWRRSVPHHLNFDRWRLRVCLLRARMLAFVQQILAFTTFEVLEPNWRALEGKLDKVTTVDQLLRDHVDFLDTCLKECMLTSSKLLRVRFFFFFFFLLAPDLMYAHLELSHLYSIVPLGLFTPDRDLFYVCLVHLEFHKISESSDCSRRDARRRSSDGQTVGFSREI